MVGVPQLQEAFNSGSKVRDYSIGVQKVSLCARLHMVWPLKAWGILKSLAFKLSAA